MYLSPFLSDNAGTANADIYTDKDIRNEIKRLRAVISQRQRERMCQHGKQRRKDATGRLVCACAFAR